MQDTGVKYSMALSPPPLLIEVEIFLRWELCISKDAQHSFVNPAFEELLVPRGNVRH